MNKLILIAILLVTAACQNSDKKREQKIVSDENKDPTKIYNLMGEILPPKSLSEEEKVTYTGNLVTAEQKFLAYPDSLELTIWYGRRLAYLGRYLDAIKVYSDGLIKFPKSYRLRRHRGHCYISTRQLNKAIKDFEMAAYHSLNAQNAIEPDGLPNKFNQPVGNDKFNIWYHFGLAHYLNGRYDKALSAYTKCMEFSDNDDLIVATTYWQYLTYKKLGNDPLASDLLNKMTSPLTLLENDSYQELIFLFQGKNEVEALIKSATTSDGNLNPTLAYGIGCYFQHEGKSNQANEIFLKIIESPSWHSFGYIGAEAELKTIFPVP